MSGTQPTTTQVAPPAPTASSEWKTPAGIVSVYSLTLMLVALGIACYLKIDNAITILIGAIVANGTTVVNFYMGSSRSSQTKDATIASQLTGAPNSTTVTSAPATVTVASSGAETKVTQGGTA